MSQTIAYKVVGPSTGLSVAATSHAAVTITPLENTLTNFALFENTSSSLIIYVTVSGGGIAAAASTIPGDGTAGSIPILPLQSKALAVPQGPISVTAIASGAGPSLLVVTPIASM